MNEQKSVRINKTRHSVENYLFSFLNICLLFKIYFRIAIWTPYYNIIFGHKIVYLGALVLKIILCLFFGMSLM